MCSVCKGTRDGTGLRISIGFTLHGEKMNVGDAPLLHRRIIERAIELRARHHDRMKPMSSSGVAQDETQFS